MRSVESPRVPYELEPLLNDQVLSVHERWANYTFDDVRRQIPRPLTTTLSSGERLRYVDLNPNADSEVTTALFLPHAQGWKPSMFIRAEFARQAIDPNMRMIVFPQNTVGDSYYQLSEDDKEELGYGTLAPLAEKYVRTLEGLSIGKVGLSGYSLGGLIAPEVSLVGSDTFEVTHINTDEAPSKKRTAEQLLKDFRKSGGWGDQRKAINDAGIPALSQALNVGRLAADYGRFGVTAVCTNSARLLHKAMAESESEYSFALTHALRVSPTVSVKIGRMAGSRMVDVNAVPKDTRLRFVTYGETSNGAEHMHTTGDNVVAHALMMLDGLRQSID